MTEVQERRETIARLYAQNARGDLPGRTFQRRIADEILGLCRAVIRERLEPGETILGEHHVVRAHTRLTRSVLRESDQENISLFATDRRLLRLRFLLPPSQPVSCDHRDHARVDDLPYERIAALTVRREVRWGEAAAGAAILAFAFLFRGALQITGPVLMLVGLAGLLHGLALPTRWIEVRAHGVTGDDPIRILAPRKRSARALAARVRERIRPGG